MDGSSGAERLLGLTANFGSVDPSRLHSLTQDDLSDISTEDIKEFMKYIKSTRATIAKHTADQLDVCRRALDLRSQREPLPLASSLGHSSPPSDPLNQINSISISGNSLDNNISKNIQASSPAAASSPHVPSDDRKGGDPAPRYVPVHQAAAIEPNIVPHYDIIIEDKTSSASSAPYSSEGVSSHMLSPNQAPEPSSSSSSTSTKGSDYASSLGFLTRDPQIRDQKSHDPSPYVASGSSSALNEKTSPTLSPSCRSEERYLDWERRKFGIVDIFLDNEPTVMCRQEVERSAFEFFKAELKNYKGYHALSRNGKEGVAIFYQSLSCKEISLKTTYVDSAKVQSQKVGLAINLAVDSFSFVVATIHLNGDPTKPWLPCQEVSTFLSEVGRQYRDVPLIFCGDLNSDPDSTVYRIVEKQTADSFSQPYALKSSYKEINNREPEVTFCTDSIQRCVDYIFFRSDCFKVVNTLPLPTRLDLVSRNFLPNKEHPSDHLPLMAWFDPLFNTRNSSSKTMTSSLPSPVTSGLQYQANMPGTHPSMAMNAYPLSSDMNLMQFNHMQPTPVGMTGYHQAMASFPSISWQNGMPMNNGMVEGNAMAYHTHVAYNVSPPYYQSSPPPSSANFSSSEGNRKDRK